MDFDMDFLKSLISDFDLMALLPNMVDVLDWIMIAVSYALVAGPCVLVLLGLWYLILPTREANHFVGYRFFWGMGSVKSWKFTQRLAGAVWLGLGIYMASEAYDNRAVLEAMETIDLMYTAIEVILHQVWYLIVSCLSINAVVFIIFNFKGNVRRPWRWIGRKIKELFLMIGEKIKAGRAENHEEPKHLKKVERKPKNEN